MKSALMQLAMQSMQSSLRKGFSGLKLKSSLLICSKPFALRKNTSAPVL